MVHFLGALGESVEGAKAFVIESSILTSYLALDFFLLESSSSSKAEFDSGRIQVGSKQSRRFSESTSLAADASVSRFIPVAALK